MKNSISKKLLSFLLILSVVFSTLSGAIISINAEDAFIGGPDIIVDEESENAGDSFGLDDPSLPEIDFDDDFESDGSVDSDINNSANTVIINNGSGEGNNVFSFFDDSLFVNSTVNNDSTDGKALTLIATSEVTGKNHIQLKADTSVVTGLDKIEAFSFYVEIPEGVNADFTLFANNEHYELIGKVYAIGTDGTIFNNVTSLNGFKGKIVYVLPENGWDSVLMEFEDRGDILSWADFVEYEGFESFGCCLDFNDNGFSQTLVFDEVAVHYDAEKLLDGYNLLTAHKFYADYTYILKDGEVTLIKAEKTVSGEIAVPSNMLNKPVTIIDSRVFADCSDITGIFLPDTIKTIGISAFANCISLTNIIIPNTVTSLGFNAFDGCDALKDIYYLGTEDVWNDLTVEVAIPATATVHFLGNNSTVSDFEYIEENNTITITGYNGNGGVVSIPNAIDGKPVKRIARIAFINKTNITSVILPNGLFFIEDFAFMGCTGLTNVYIPKSVFSIGNNIFKNCSNLKSIDVAHNNMDYCAVDGVLYNKDKTTILSYPPAKAGDYKMPDTVTTIGMQAFWCCYNLTNVTFSKALTEIGEFAFFECIGFKSIVLPDGIKTIKSNAFASCYNIKNVVVPNSVTTIGADVATGCTEIKNIFYFGSQEDLLNISIEGNNGNLFSIGIEYIENGIYSNGLIYTIDNNCAAVYKYVSGSDIVISSEVEGYPVTTVGSAAFNGCTDITSVVIPNGITIIDSAAFLGCINLCYVSLPESLKVIAPSAFSACRNIFNISIPDGVTTIGSNAFANCQMLDSIIIPDKVTKIDINTFMGCTNLISVKIPKSVVNIAVNAFNGCSALNFVEYNGSESEWNSITIENGNDPLVNAYKVFARPEVDSSDFEYTISDGEVTITKYIGTDTEVVIPDYIEDCPVTKIGDWAFDSCSNIISVTVGNNITIIGQFAFSCCSSLMNVILGNSVTTIEAAAFSVCPSLTEIAIPDSVTTIGYYAFDSCSNITTVSIGSGVTNIIEGAFYNLPITDVYYNGTQAQWDNISIEIYNNSLENATIHFNECAECAFGDWIIRTDATCNTDGVKYRVCSNCGKEETEIIPVKSEHNFGDWIYSCEHGWVPHPNPNINKEVFRISFSLSRTCLDCGMTENDMVNPDETGLIVETFPPSCMENGYTYIYCPICNSEFTINEVPATGAHNFGDWYYYCEHYLNSPIPEFLGGEGYSHIFTKVRNCLDCGSEESEPAMAGEIGFHTVVVDPTCESQGYTAEVCPNCGQQFEHDYVPETGHNYSSTVYAPSCDWDGYTEYYCDLCGDWYQDNFVPATGHDYYTEYTSEPDCDNSGYTYKICAHCGNGVYEDYVDALGHDYSAVVTNPTCFTEGYTTYSCGRCGYCYTDNYVSAYSNHNYVLNSATNCKENKYICTECGTPCADIYTTAGSKITNDYLAFTVNGSNYALHTTGGDPDITTDDNVRLLYGELGNGTSDTIIRINGVDYTFESYNNFINSTGDSIYSYAVYDGVLVQRYCNFVYNIYTQRKDTLEIKFVFTNISSANKTAGTRIFFDTMLGSNDSAPFRVPGMGDITYEREYTGDNIPQLWQVFNSLSNPTVFASGTFYENFSERPDKVQFIRYSNGSSNVWDSYINGEGFGDSAVNIYYDPAIITSGESRVVGTYYGLSQFTSDDSNLDLKATVVAPSELLLNDLNDAYRNNPFTVNGWIVNESSSEILNNVKIKIQLPEGLQVVDQPLEFSFDSILAGANQAFAWQITALPKFRNTLLTYTITLSADDKEDAVYTYTINIPALPATLCPHEEQGEWIIDSYPDCINNGSRHKVCLICDSIMPSEEIPALGHELGNWYTVTSATCTENGLERMDCSRCDYHEDRVIEAKGHLYYKYSFRCNHIPTTDLEDKYINSLDKIHYCYYCTHTLVETGVSDERFDMVSTTKLPNCEDYGCIVHYCPGCRFEYEDHIVPALGHSYDTIVTAPTYFAQGYTTYNCNVCNHTYVDDYVPALERKDISQADLILEFTDVFYKGVAITPSVIYTDSNGMATSINGEFTVQYINNNKVGTATVIITGINEFVGTKELYFNISYEFIPEKIANVIAIGEIGKISLSWVQSVEYNTDRYNIYRKSEYENEFVLIKTIYGRDNLAYVDNNVEKAVTYSYYVTGVGLYGAESEASDTVTATVQVDHQAPTILKINPSTNSVISGSAVISTKATDNVAVVRAKYYYSVDDGESWILLGESTNSELSVVFNTTVVSDSVIKIKVNVYDAENNESDSYVATYSIDNVGPDKVTGLSAEPLSNKLTLSWNDVTANDASYFVLETLKNGVWTVVARNITTKGYVITNLEPDTAYTFRVACVDVYGNIGEYSDEYIARTATDITAPVITKQSPSSSRYNSTVNYSATAKDDCNIAIIEIQVSTDLINWNTVSARTFTDKKYSASHSYIIDLSSYPEGSLYVRAIATDFAGNVSDESENAPYSEYIIDRTAPEAPKNVTANGNDGYITVSWSQGTEFDLGRYFVYRATSLDGDYVLIASNLSTLNFHDRNVDTRTEYFYKIKVSDSCGNMSAYSNTVSATISPDTVKPEITSITSTYNQKINNNNSNIVVSANDNNSLSYIVVEYYTSDNLEYTELIRKENINNHYSDLTVKLPLNGLADGDYIFVRAYAVDMAGLRSDYAFAKYTLDLTSPEVIDFNAQINNSDVYLSWKSNTEADLSGFKVYRSNDGVSFSFIGSRSVNSTGVYSFEDYISAQADGTYVYKVEAIDRIGNSSYKLASVNYTYLYINKAPAANMIIPAYLTVGVEELFDASGSYDNKIIVKYLWDFGDGTTSADIKPIKKYTAEGKYTVTLTVTDNEGLSSTIIGSVEVKARESIGVINVYVVDENGKRLPFVPVYFDLGSENQKIVNTNSNGMASLQMSTGTHVIGMYKAGYLPVKKDVVVLANATRTITLTTVEEELVTGKFEITRMTFDEIVAAGIDVYDPDNQHVYSATVRVTYGSTPPINISYIRNDNKIIDYTITDWSGKPTNRYTNGSGEDRIITGVTYIGGGWGWGGGGSGSSETDIVAILDIPASASYLKEFFDVKLHIINNASSDFTLIQNEVTLNVPNGMTLMDSVSGDYLTTNKVSIPSIRGQQNVTLAWVLRGDKAGDYDLTADFIGTLAEFNEIVTATFKTDEPIKVYGLQGVKFRILAADKIYNSTLYFNVELENQRDIDINMPAIGITKKIHNVTESVLNNNPNGDFYAKAFLLNVFIQTDNGEKLYLPVTFDENGEVVTNLKLLAPGQKLVFEYVVYNAINYAGIAYFKDATVREFEGLIENIETGSFSKDYYSFNDYTKKLDNILDGNDSKVENAYNYIFNDSNYYYVDESDRIVADLLKSLYNTANAFINGDISHLTQSEEREVIQNIILKILAESSIKAMAEDLIDDKYTEAAKIMLQQMCDNLVRDLSPDDERREKIDGAFKDLIGEARDLGLTYKVKGASEFEFEIDKKLAEKLSDTMVLDLDYDSISAFGEVLDWGTETFNYIFDVFGAMDRDACYYAFLKANCNNIVSERILDAIINSALEEIGRNMIEHVESGDFIIEGLLNPLPSYISSGLSPATLIYTVALSMKSDLQSNCEIFRNVKKFIETVLVEGIEVAYSIFMDKVVKAAMCSTPLILVTVAFNVIDAFFGFENYVKQQESFDIYKDMTDIFKRMFQKNIVNRNHNDDFYSMLYLRVVCEMRLDGEGQFEKYMYDYVDGVYGLKMDEEDVVSKINRVKRTNYSTLDEWSDTINYNMVSSRDILFNIESASAPKIPKAPVVTLDYDTLHTKQVFTDEYEFCFADGVWKQCQNMPIAFLLNTVPSTLRVRKAATDTTLAGEITTVRIFARKDLSKLITVKYDGLNYIFGNLSSDYSYQIVFTNSDDENVDWSNAVTISGSSAKLSGYRESEYIVIRSMGNSSLYETSSNPLVRKVSKKYEFNIDIVGKGTVSQSSSTGYYFIGDTINLVANPSTGSEFDGWYINGVCVGKDIHYLAEMSENLSITAKFTGASITRIEISQLPTKLTYYEGENINLAGINVLAYYSDGNFVEVSDYTASIDSNVVGNSSVTVKFGGKSTGFEMEIIHSLTDWMIISPATHFENGVKVRKCSICGKVIETDTIPMIAHTYTEQIVEPTCNENGYTLYSCSCGDSYKDNFIDALGHNYGDWMTRVNATCTEDGLEYHLCTRCDHEETRVTEAIGHNYEAVVTAPDCVNSGFTTHTCTNCSDSYVDSETPALGHNYGDWMTRVNATCTEDGLEYHLCTRCDYEETRVIEAIGHNYESVVTAPDCVNRGFTTHTCTNCSDSYVDSETPALGHNYGDRMTRVNATCTEDGLEYHLCTRCDHEETRVTEAIGHNYEAVVTAPDCVNRGFTTHTCTNCSDSYVDSETPALGHNYGDWMTRVNATCTEDGLEYHLCTRCDYEETRVIEAKGHSYSDDWTIDVEPTFTTDGSKSRHCLYCNSVTDVTVIPALGLGFEYEFIGGAAIITGYNGDKAEIVIPSDIDGFVVTKIADDAFYNNKAITSVTLPNTIVSIGYWAFDNCDNITEIKFNGTTEEWNGINICYGNKILDTVKIYYLGEVIYGDVNGDGRVDSIDLVRMRKMLLGEQSDDENQTENVDTNGDGLFDVRDLVRIKKYLVGLDVILGVSSELPDVA